MKRSLVFIAAVSLIVLVLTACTAAPANSKSEVTRQLNASGTGRVFLKPDVAYVYIGVNSRAKSVTEALQDNNNKAQSISQALTGMGVDAADIQTSAFNVFPQQQVGPNGETLGTEYVVDNSVYVTVRDLQKLGQMLDTVVQSGANSINGVQFDVNDKETALSNARQMAIEDAKKNAQELAKAGGVELGNLITLNVYGSPAPVAMFEGKGGVGSAAANNVPVSAGQLILTVNADLSYEIR
jgi:uncharacterized protein